ncbi:MAG: cytochrome c oxidase subunit II [Acidiferrobacterales bacterium]
MSISIKKLSGPATLAMTRLFVGIGLLLFAGAAAADYAINFPTPVTPTAAEIYHLQNIILVICAVIFVIVFGFMFYSIFAHRKSRGYKAATFHESTTIEVIWTAIPFLILVGMAIPSTATLLKMENSGDADLTVKITGYQWKWQYEYPEQGISFFSSLSTPTEQIENQAAKDKHYLLEVDNPLVLPVGEKVRFLITANDVIHSWWVPSFGIKTDAIPGFINESWAKIDVPGTYRGQCAELCGKDHGFMPIVVKAVSQDDFNKWVSTQKAQLVASAADTNKTWTKDDLLSQGQKVFTANCAACHQATGEGLPGTFPPLAGGKKFSASADLMKNLQSRGFMTKDGRIVMGPVENHLNIVMNGIPGTAMQAFAKQLTDADIAAVITYERNSFGNHTGDVIQPSQVTALR